jgi:excisionase family DNA binding protein
MKKSRVLERSDQPAERLNGLLRKREIAELLKVSPRTIDKYVAKRLIPFIRMNPRFNLFRLADVERALARRTVREDAGA